MSIRIIAALGLVVGVAACNDPGGGGDGPTVRCEAPVAPPCQDEQIQQLFAANPTDGQFVNDGVAGVFTTDVDATAGGVSGTEGFIYGRFTDAGLTKFEATDEESLDRMEWDIAFRRFVVRLNSGPGGPSCVGAQQAIGDFTSITEVPGGAYSEENYYDGTCTLVPDASGLGTSPNTVLSTYWTYPGCVAMTDNVYVLELASGRHVKLQVLRYYGSGQDGCNTSGTMGSQSANIQIRWAFLD